MITTYWCELAWMPGEDGGVVPGVLISIDGERITSIVPEQRQPPPGAVRLPGLTLPGLANSHSHAFHRALRGRTQTQRGSFWTWREQMYGAAERFDPDSYYALAKATYAEMALAGITSVAEFHYVHHAPDGKPYDDRNAMGHALIQAARDAGLRIALLDACYLTGGFGAPLRGPQRRFGDGDATRWAERAGELAGQYVGADDVVIGAAVHSVRAVPPEQIPEIVEWTRHQAAPLHTHMAEQRAEVEQCVQHYAATPARLLHEHDALGPRATVIHATHLSAEDVALLGGSGTHVCMCPTTERDLADGIGAARQLLEAGSPITLGTDSHAVIDMFEEARAVELDERLASETRGHWRAGELLEAATTTGHASLGFAEAGLLVPGAWADLVSVRLDSVRTAGVGASAAAEAVVFAATASDVYSVISRGRRIVEDGQHVLGDVGRLLAAAVPPE